MSVTRWSRAFIPTLKEPPVDAVAVSHQLLVRAAFVRQVVSPALERGEIVVADRFSLSTLAYQGYGRGLDLAEVRRMDAFARGGVEPDLVLLLDLPTEEGVRRQRASGKSGDRIERAGAAFHERVAAGYRELAGSGSAAGREPSGAGWGPAGPVRASSRPTAGSHAGGSRSSNGA